MKSDKRLVIGADHAGYKLKQYLVEHLKKKGYDVLDVGTFDETSVDYPDYAVKVGRRVAGGEFSKGVLVCGSGAGVSIAANKIQGIRAATANDIESAKLIRAHNDANVLTVGSRLVDFQTALRILDTWLETEFEGGRHARRVDKIRLIEKEERS
ncbi:MAG TPA: ribose 5-phosphate isomerase B [Actinobacteria bacterium]|nr:ribose 5-phosphate isomerase B [Actinomycetota bacterium]